MECRTYASNPAPILEPGNILSGAGAQIIFRDSVPSLFIGTKQGRRVICNSRWLGICSRRIDTLSILSGNLRYASGFNLTASGISSWFTCLASLTCSFRVCVFFFLGGAALEDSVEDVYKHLFLEAMVLLYELAFLLVKPQ